MVGHARERKEKRMQQGRRGDEEAPEETPTISLPLALVESDEEISPTEGMKKKKKREKYVDPWRTAGLGDMDADDLTLVDGHLALKEKPKKDDSSSQIDAENKENESLSSYNQPVIIMSPDRLDHSRPLVYTRILLDFIAIITHIFGYITLPNFEFWILRMLSNLVFWAACIAPGVSVQFFLEVLASNKMRGSFANKSLGILDLLFRFIVLVSLLFEIDSAFDWYGRIITVEYDDPGSGDGFNVTEFELSRQQETGINPNATSAFVDCCTEDTIFQLFINMIITFLLTFFAFLYALYYFYVEFLCMELQESLCCICCRNIGPIYGEL